MGGFAIEKRVLALEKDVRAVEKGVFAIHNSESGCTVGGKRERRLRGACQDGQAVRHRISARSGRANGRAEGRAHAGQEREED